MKRRIAAAACVAAMISGFAAAPAMAVSGGGNSGQCTGPAQERPGNACASGNK